MKHGDFSELAKDYINRPGYSLDVLRMLCALTGAGKPGFIAADVGAGTGKLTENLIECGLSGFAVEPNDAMREEGVRLCPAPERVKWLKGSAEATTLPDACADWVLMGSSFHWTDHPVALREFFRILRPGGYFTAVWNPRDVERSRLHSKIEGRIREIVPGMKRVSSGSRECTEHIDKTLLEGGLFGDLVFVEARHTVEMSPERYIGAWRSVNDIQVQAGPEGFARILGAIAEEIRGLDTIVSYYKTRAWTVRKAAR